MNEFIDGLGLEIARISAAARPVATTHAKWGKGRLPAKLNFGDRVAYEVAKAHACPLLHVGEYFARTDIESVP